MDYKKLIKSRKLRIQILHMLDFIPDRWMVSLQYRIKLGRWPNLKNPQRYSEKLQWYKLNYRDDKMKRCTDKQEVRDYVSECGYAGILNEQYGLYNSPDEIDFEKLPKSFVIKDTLGSGGNSVILVFNKDEEDIEKLCEILKEWVNKSDQAKNPGREWVYEGVKHRIIIEKLIMGDENGDLPDYKFFCFNGKPYCLYLMKNYTMHHEEGILGFLSPDFVLLPAHRSDFNKMTEQPEKPENYERMLEIATKLSEGFPHVRVDMYNVNGKIIFGEMTFFNASGYVKFEPDEFDYTLGCAFDLPQ